MRYYTNSTIATTLNAGITATSTTIILADMTGLPTNYPYTLILDLGTANEEIVEVTGGSGGSLQVLRGVDNSVALAHASNATVTHGVSARDYADSRNHENASLGVHGIAAASQVVGTTDTQTLTNKTLQSPTINSPTFTSTQLPAASVTGTLSNSQQGVYATTIVGTFVTDGGDVLGAGYCQVTVNFPSGRFAFTPAIQVTMATAFTQGVGVTWRITHADNTLCNIRADGDPRNPGMIGKSVTFNVTATPAG